MIKNLTKIANKLDQIGLTKEADILDSVIRKLSQSADGGEDRKAVIIKVVVQPGQNLYDISKEHSFPVKMTLQDNIDLNKEKNPGFDPDSIKPGQTLHIWSSPQAEGFNTIPTDL